MADNKDPLGILSEQKQTKDPLGILSEEPVKKKELALPSTDFSAASQFSQQKPTATIPFREGVKERIDFQKELEPQIKKQREVFETLKTNYPNSVNDKVAKINTAIELNKLKVLEGQRDLLNKRAELDKESAQLENLRRKIDYTQDPLSKQSIIQEYNTSLEKAKAKESEFNQLKTDLDNINLRGKKLEKGVVAIKSMSDEKNSTFVNSFNNFYNNTLPQLAKGVGYMVGAAMDINEMQSKMMAGINPFIDNVNNSGKSIGDYVRDVSDKVSSTISLDVDDAFKNQSIFEKDANGDYINLKSPTAWANFITSTGGQLATTIATGGVGGSGIAMASGMFTSMPDIYKGAIEAGLSKQEAALFSVPIAFTVGSFEEAGAAPFIAKSARNAFFKQLGKEMTVEAAGKKITPELIQKVFGKAYQNAFTKTASKLGNIVTDALPEAGGEAAEQSLQGLGEMVYDALPFGGKGKEKGKGAFGTTFKDVFIQSAEAAAGGGIAAVPFSTWKSLSSSQRGDLVELIKDASTNNDTYKSVLDGLDELKVNNEITQGQYNQYVNRFKGMVAMNSKIPPTIEGDARLEAMDLVKEKNDLLEQKKNVDASFHEELNNKITELDTKLKELVTKPEKPVTEKVAFEKPITEITYNFERNKPENISKFEYYTKEENGVTKYFKKEKISEEKAPTKEDLTPTILVNGKEYSGTNHGEAMDNAIAAGEDIPDWRTPEGEVWRQENGLFKQKDGNLLTRDETEQQFGIRRSEQLEQKEVAKSKPGASLFSEPAEDVKMLSEKYRKNNNITTGAGERIYDIDPEQSKRISEEYDKMQHNPNDPDVRAAYEAMANETIDQYNLLKDGGYQVEIYEGEGEPYANSQEMIKDLRDNKHLFVLSTEKEFGQGKITDAQRSENPLLRDSGIKDKNGKTLLINDVFRFVHDAFGHGERGNSFGAKGEENAWDVHARMYSPLARRAMTTETRGQNSWVNFSGKNEDVFNKFKEANKLQKEGRTEEANKLRDEARKEMKFAEQKIGLLPEWASQLPEEKLQAISVTNAPEGIYMNIGMLEFDTDTKMSKEEILSKIPKSAMVLESNEIEGTEPSLSLKLSRPLTNGEMNTLLKQTKQLAIPQLINGEGTIHGSKQWGEFAQEYFVMPNGEKLSYLTRKRDITSPIIKRISRVIDKPIQVLSKSDFAKALSEAINTGKVKLQAWGGYIKNGFEETEDYKKLKELGVVEEGFDINKIADKDIFIISPDNMMVGSVTDPKTGQVIVEGMGGVNYVLKTGKVWAHSNSAKSNNMVRWINNQIDKDGVAYIVLTKGTDPKLLNTHVGAKGAMSLLENLVDKGLISVSDFRKALITAGKSYGLNFNATSDLKTIHNEVKTQFYEKPDSTFERRGDFVHELLVETISNARKSKRFNWDGIKQELNIEGGTFKTPDIKNAIGRLFADEMTINGNVGDAYSVIEIKSKVREEENRDEHIAYPSTIVTEDGSKPRLLVMDSPRYIGDIANNEKGENVKPLLDSRGVIKPPHMMLGSGNTGFAYGKIKPQSELNSVKLMAKAKANKISGTYYEPHMTETKDGKNYVFFHVSSADEASIKKGIDSSKYYSTKTSRAEKGLQYGVASYYTKDSDGERMISGNKYAVLVPKDKVYPIDLDPNGYRSIAEKRTANNTPFRQEAIKRKMSELAKKDGYEMIVAEWYYDRKTGESGNFPSMRADALVALKPEKEIGKYKTNEDKEIYHPERQDEIIAEEMNAFLDDASSYLSEKGKFEDAYDLIENYRVYGGIPTEQEFDTIINELPKKLKNKADSIRNKINFQSGQLGDFYGFELNGQIYLNDELINPNTPIHEAGHIWIDWAQQDRPDLFEQGMNKIEGSTYLEDVKQNSFYNEQANKLPEADRELYYKKEALAKAIGDNGEKFATETEKKSFKEWLISMWRGVIKHFGIKTLTPDELSKLTIDEFSTMIAADILEGKQYGEYVSKGDVKSEYVKPKVEGVKYVTPVEDTTFDMVIDQNTGNKKYNNKEESMLDYNENGLIEFGETYEEFLQRVNCK